MSSSIINIENVNKWFGDFQVLKDINLEVQPKQKIVVCGPSGSGKSTLIRCINRLEDTKKVKLLLMEQNLVKIQKILSKLELKLVWFSNNLIYFRTYLF